MPDFDPLFYVIVVASLGLTIAAAWAAFRTQRLWMRVALVVVTIGGMAWTVFAIYSYFFGIEPDDAQGRQSLRSVAAEVSHR